MHERSCCILQGLNDNLLQDLEREITNSSADISTTCEETQMERSMQTEISTKEYLKPGIKLTKKSWEWEAANGYFQVVFSNQPIEFDHLDWHIRHSNDFMYDYFQKNHGVVNSPSNAVFSSKYKGQSVKDLKVTLSKLELKGSDVNEIEF